MKNKIDFTPWQKFCLALFDNNFLFTKTIMNLLLKLIKEIKKMKLIKFILKMILSPILLFLVVLMIIIGSYKNLENKWEKKESINKDWSTFLYAINAAAQTANPTVSKRRGMGSVESAFAVCRIQTKSLYLNLIKNLTRG